MVQPCPIFDDQLCEPAFLEHRRQHISVEPVNAKCPRKGQSDFLLAPQIESWPVEAR